MPPVVVAVAASVTFQAVAVYSTIAATLASIAVSRVLTNVLGLDKTPNLPDFSADASNRAQVVKSAVADRRIVYGEIPMSGPLVYATSTGEDNKFLHLVIPLADHECEAINSVYLGEYEIRNSQIDSNGYVIEGRYVDNFFTGNAYVDGATNKYYFENTGVGLTLYNEISVDDNIAVSGFATSANNGIKTVVSKALNEPYTVVEVSESLTTEGSDTGLVPDVSIGQSLVRIKKHLGSTSQTADADLVSEVTEWTTDHRLRGVAYVYVRLEFNSEVFPNGIPNVKAIVKGRKIYDPRSATTAWSDNWALCVRDYITASNGLAADSSEVNDTLFQSAANTSDETVLLPDYTTGVVYVENGSAVVVGDGTGWRGRVEDGDTFILAGDSNTYTISTVDTDEQITLTTNYTGTSSTTPGDSYTIERSQSRYTCNGSVDLGTKPADILEQLVSAGAGAIVYSQGEYKLFAGEYTSPVASLDEDDLRGEIKVRPDFPRQNLFNAVRGTYLGVENFWQPADFPAVTNATYATQDGETIYKDIQLPYTTNSHRAQRIGKISLEKSRQGITVEFPAKFTALELTAMDNIQLTIDRLGWTNKEFKILDWSLANTGINLTLQEEASASYTWNSGDATTVDPAPDTNLPDPTSVTAPTGLTLNSGESYLLLGDDGSIVSRIYATWTALSNRFTGGYRVEAKLSSDSAYSIYVNVDGRTNNEAYIAPVKDGVDYDVRIKAVNILGYSSEWTTVTNHTVIGKSSPPDDVTSLTAAQNGDVAVFRWTQVTNVDLAGYEIRYGPIGSSWEDATPLTSVTRGTNITTADIPPGTWLAFIKAVDTTGNYSTNAISDPITFSNTYDVITSVSQQPDWSGTLTNCIRHWTGVLSPDSQNLASDDDWDTFDLYVPNPYTTYSYESPEIDIDFDDNVRTWSDITSALGPSETGLANPEIQLDYRTESGSYGGFKTWSIGNRTGRYFKYKLINTNSTGLCYVSEFNNNVDNKEETTKQTISVTSGSATATFDNEYHVAPFVKPVYVGSNSYFAAVDNITTTGCDVYLYNESGTGVTGTVELEIIGV